MRRNSLTRATFIGNGRNLPWRARNCSASPSSYHWNILRGCRAPRWTKYRRYKGAIFSKFGFIFRETIDWGDICMAQDSPDFSFPTGFLRCPISPPYVNALIKSFTLCIASGELPGIVLITLTATYGAWVQSQWYRCTNNFIAKRTTEDRRVVPYKVRCMLCDADGWREIWEVYDIFFCRHLETSNLINVSAPDRCSLQYVEEGVGFRMFMGAYTLFIREFLMAETGLIVLYKEMNYIHISSKLHIIQWYIPIPYSPPLVHFLQLRTFVEGGL